MARKLMSFEDLRKLLNVIEKQHRFGTSIKTPNFKGIKYVDPIIDMRTHDIFCITLRGLYGEKTFSLTNENKDKDLFKWIMEYLDESEEI